MIFKKRLFIEALCRPLISKQGNKDFFWSVLKSAPLEMSAWFFFLHLQLIFLRWLDAKSFSPLVRKCPEKFSSQNSTNLSHNWEEKGPRNHPHPQPLCPPALLPSCPPHHQKRVHFMAAGLPRKHLKITNLRTWEPQMLPWLNLPRLCIFMRPFIWQKIGAWPIGRRRVWSKNLWKNAKIGLISSNFQDYIQNSITYDTLCCTGSLVQISKESDGILGNYTKKTTLKQPKIHSSGPMKTFEIL